MSFQPNNDGSTTPRRAAASGREAAAWPVLARLPWVGEPAAVQPEPLPALTPLTQPPNAAPHRESIALRTFDGAAPNQADLDPLELLTLDEPAPPTRRSYVDQPHATVRGYDWPAATEASVAVEAAIRETSGRRTLRVDRGVPRLANSTASPLPQHSVEPPRSTFAAHVFQLHAAVAPYAGVVMTLALVASASLLCWLTFMQPRSEGVPNHSPSPAAWPTETAKQGPPVDNSSAATTPRLPVIQYPVAPIVQTQTFPPVAESPKTEAADPKIETPALTLSTPTAEAKTTDAKTAVAAQPQSPVSAPQQVAAQTSTSAPQVQPPITPTPIIAPYPTTPYAVINFGPPAAQSVPQRLSTSAAPSATR